MLRDIKNSAALLVLIYSCWLITQSVFTTKFCSNVWQTRGCVLSSGWSHSATLLSFFFVFFLKAAWEDLWSNYQGHSFMTVKDTPSHQLPFLVVVDFLIEINSIYYQINCGCLTCYYGKKYFCLRIGCGGPEKCLYRGKTPALQLFHPLLRSYSLWSWALRINVSLLSCVWTEFWHKSWELFTQSRLLNDSKRSQSHISQWGVPEEPVL